MAALTKRVFVVMATVFLCSAFCLPPAEAALVPIAITADVTDVRDDYDFLEGRVNIGDLITGVYIYDSSTLDLEPAEIMGVYDHYTPPAGITLTVGGFVFMTDPGNVEFIVEIGNDVDCCIPMGGCYPCDTFSLESVNNLQLSNGVSLDYIRFVFTDDHAGALSSDALPTSAPVLDDWDIRRIEIDGRMVATVPVGRGGYHYYRVRGNLTSAALIPEPATFALLGIGTLVLLRSRRATKRKHKGRKSYHLPV